MRAEDIEKLVSVGRPDDRARRLVRRLRDIAARSRRQPRGRPAVARRPSRRHAAPPHARDGGRRAAAVAGRLAHRLPARRREGQAADLRRRRRRAASRCRRPTRRWASASSTGRPTAASLAFTRPHARAGPLRLGRGAGCRGRGAAAHHRHPLARQRARLPRRPAGTASSSSRRPDLDAEPFYEPAAAVRPDGETPPKKQSSPPRRPQLTEGAVSHSGAVFARRRDPDRRRRDRAATGATCARVLVAVRVDGSGEREVVGRDADLSIDDVAVAADGADRAARRAMSDRRASTSSPPGVALWILDDGGAPRRLTDAETIDLGEVGSHITAVGDDFLVQDRTRGRVRLLVSSRPATCRELLGGDVEVAGHARGGRSGSSRPSPRPTPSASSSSSTDGSTRTLTAFGAPAAAAGVAAPREFTIDGRDGYPVHGWVATAGRRRAVPGDPADPRRTVCLVRHPSLRRDAGAGGRRLRRRVLQPARFRGLRTRARSQHPSVRWEHVDFADVIDFLDGAVAARRRASTVDGSASWAARTAAT